MRPTEEQAKSAYERAPEAIQNALTDGPAIDFMAALQTRYSLHIDVAGEVVERIRNLLLGLSSPTEFLGELIQLGMSDTVARTLVEDLNKEVFIPLREEMRKAPESTGAPEPIAVPQRSLGAETPLPAPSLAYEPEPKTLPGSPVVAPMPTPTPISTPAPIVENNAPAPVAHAVYPMHPNQQGGWHPAAAVHIYVPSQGMPYAAHKPAPLEHVAEAMPVTTPTVEAPQVSVPAQVAEPIPAPAPAPAAQPRTADPYREPV